MTGRIGHRDIGIDLGFEMARPAGFEPATRCLEGRFTQGVKLGVSRLAAICDVRE